MISELSKESEMYLKDNQVISYYIQNYIQCVNKKYGCE